MSNQEVVLVGRSSSHFTRTARIFAHELGVAHGFRPVLDMTTLNQAAYADNPALKVPVLIDEQGPLFGTENICRALADRSGERGRVVLRGDVTTRLVANAEEMLLHAMNSEVIIILNTLPGSEGPPSPKVRRSLENTLGFLDSHLDQARDGLPVDRRLSFFETALYCVVTHLPFRKIMSVSAYPNLGAFAAEFDQRPGAQATPYRFDAA
jgi:glutathione S-transferase